MIAVLSPAVDMHRLRTQMREATLRDERVVIERMLAVQRNRVRHAAVAGVVLTGVFRK